MLWCLRRPLASRSTLRIRRACETVVLDIERNIVDGHQRVRIARELGTLYPIAVFVPQRSIEMLSAKDARSVMAANIKFHRAAQAMVRSLHPSPTQSSSRSPRKLTWRRSRGLGTSTAGG
jgi:hypothetical protein